MQGNVVKKGKCNNWGLVSIQYDLPTGTLAGWLTLYATEREWLLSCHVRELFTSGVQVTDRTKWSSCTALMCHRNDHWKHLPQKQQSNYFCFHLFLCRYVDHVVCSLHLLPYEWYTKCWYWHWPKWFVTSSCHWINEFCVLFLQFAVQCCHLSSGPWKTCVALLKVLPPKESTLK